MHPETAMAFLATLKRIEETLARVAEALERVVDRDR
jgi:hypothetical protein